MVRRRLPVLVISGIVSIAVIASALWIRHLGQRVALLEESVQALVVPSQEVGLSSQTSNLSLVPADNKALTVNWTTVETPDHTGRGERLPDIARFPDGTTSHTINGMTYYVTPLADSSDVADRR